MPLISRRNLLPEGELGVWKIEESEDFFYKNLELTEAESQFLKEIKGKGRRMEWIATRYLLHYLTGREKRGTLYKDEFGKPHLENSDFQISITHSHGMAAAIGAPEPVGIDLQYFVPKIELLAHKYMRKEEWESVLSKTRLEHLHVYWCAKEVLYKAYGRRQLAFIDHLLIEPFEFKKKGGTFKGVIRKDDFLAHYQLWYEIVENDYFLVFGKEIPNP